MKGQLRYSMSYSGPPGRVGVLACVILAISGQVVEVMVELVGQYFFLRRSFSLAVEQGDDISSLFVIVELPGYPVLEDGVPLSRPWVKDEFGHGNFIRLAEEG